MSKPSLKDLMAEEEMQLSTVLKASKAAPAAAEVKAKVVGRGRPKTKPESKLTSFHLPLDLIVKIDAEAVATAGGNKSALLIKILESHFAEKSD